MAKKRGFDDLDSVNNNDDLLKQPPLKKQKLSVSGGKRHIIIGLDDDDDDVDITANVIHTDGEPIELNVGGYIYQTSLTTLSGDTNSVLYKMFNGKFSLKPNNDGSYFIDRNGRYFIYILDYLRNNKLNIPNRNDGDYEYLLNHLLIESEYYHLISLTKLIKKLIHKQEQNKIELKFDTIQYSENYLTFINEKHVQCSKHNGVGSICLLKESISSTICNKYEIMFKLHSCSNETEMFVSIGYVSSKNDIKNWNVALGIKDNRQTTCGIYILLTIPYFVLDDDNHEDCILSCTPKSTLKKEDIFGLRFDFVEDNFQIIHNDNKTDPMPLGGIKSLIPGVSLYDEGDSIELIKHKMY